MERGQTGSVKGGSAPSISVPAQQPRRTYLLHRSAVHCNKDAYHTKRSAPARRERRRTARQQQRNVGRLANASSDAWRSSRSRGCGPHVATVRSMGYARHMAANPDDLERLVRELADLPPVERARIVAEAVRRAKKLPSSSRFHRPILTGGAGWVGGDLTRDQLYDDDGR
jgi:hypothetical protein